MTQAAGWPRLSKRATIQRPSPTLAMNQLAAELKRMGKPVIPLSLGEPDFDTPTQIKNAGIAAIAANFTKYTAADGFSDLKSAIAHKLVRENELHFDQDQIVVGSGAKLVILAALLSILDTGDEVVVPKPYWVSYPDLVELAGGTPTFGETSAATGFKLRPDALRSVITPRTRAIILNSPNNPSGAVYTAEEFQALAAVIEHYPHVWILTDEIYEHIVYDNQRAASFAAIAPALSERTITINGFSKGYVMTGWRLGYAAGPKDVMAAVANFLSQMHGSPSSIAQAAAIAGLDGDQRFLVENREVFRTRRDLVFRQVNTIKGLSADLPAGTFYVFIGCEGWIGRTTDCGRQLLSDVDVVEALLDEALIAAVPGTVFGSSPFFRVSYALKTTLLAEAMERLHKFSRALC